MSGRPSRAFWVIPCQPVQQLYGAQGNDPDPVAATVLMALIAGMAMNDGFGGVPTYHISISQRELAERTGLSRKAVCNALGRLEKRGHLTPIKGPSDGTRRGPNARVTYRIDLLLDEATAFHRREPSGEPSPEPKAEQKEPSYIQTEFPERVQTTTPRSRAEQSTLPLDAEPASREGQRNGRRAKPAKAKRSTRGTRPSDDQQGEQTRQTWISPFWDPWEAKIGEPPGTLLRAVADVKKANPAEWGSGLVLQSFLNFLEETDPKYLNDRAPLTWKAKWRAYTNDGEFYQRRVRDEAREVFG
jgi:hypothetical protein